MARGVVMDVPGMPTSSPHCPLAVPTSRAPKIVQNAVWSELQLIIINRNDKTKGCSDTTFTDTHKITSMPYFES